MKSQNEVIVITGGAGGIGQACAKIFKNELLVITDYSQELVDNATQNLKKDGFNAIGLPCDITNKQDVEELTEFVSENGKLKALINTAGVSGSVKDVEKVFTIDLIGTEILIDAFYDLVVENSVIVLLSSMMAHTVPANPKYDEALKNPQSPEAFKTVSKFVDGNSDMMYNFAKRGVILLSQKNVNKFGEKGARIVTVSPGVIETEMALKAAEEHPERMEKIKQATPLKRNGQPKDIADVVHFLISDAARFITGSDVLVDGGVIENIKKLDRQ